MVVPFIDTTTGTAVYIDPGFVATLRPDPQEPTRVTLIKLKDAESIHVQGDHEDVADKLARCEQ
ncbi:MAG TPA: hypothetical protein VGI81_08325 [Tepidisphaeraceae bacterium]|jgi:hypothetical protein